MRNSFKKLLESVKASCPDVITEEVFDGMMDQFDTGLAQVTADATAEGQALGFKEGYDEGKRVAAEQAKAELEALTEKLDAEAVEKLNSILQMIDENHTTKLQELYDYMQNNMVKREFMDAEIAKQDADYANKFETAVDALCDDHACKLEMFKEAIEAKHANDIYGIINGTTSPIELLVPSLGLGSMDCFGAAGFQYLINPFSLFK